MSWIDKIKDELIITTGDGKQYKPNWLNASKLVEYNIAEFEFPNLIGTLVKKGEPLGRKFALELYFQGDDHLDTSLAFEKSCNDKRPWTVAHPFYGTLIVQPASLLFDNSALNVSKITGVVIETITEDNPKTTVDPVDQCGVDKDTLDASLDAALTETPTATDVNTLLANNQNNYTLGVKIITIPEEAEVYFNLFNTANTYISTATASPLLAMRAMVAAITAPAKFTASVKNRVNLLTDQFALLRNNLTGISDVSSKQLYQNQGGAIVSSMALAAVTPQDGNYKNSTDVLDTVESLLAAYNSLLADLDSLQTDNGGSPESFIPDAASLSGLNGLMNLAIANLLSIALGAKKERSIITESDTNIIILTHRFYGLDPSDANMNEMIENNNLGLNGLLQIRKNTKIVYYI